MRKKSQKEKERRNEKIKMAAATAMIFGLIGLVILGGVLITQNVSAIIEKFTDTPPEAIAIFVAGAITLKVAQTLRLYLSMWLRAKRAEKARRELAIANEANAKAEAKLKDSKATAKFSTDDTKLI